MLHGVSYNKIAPSPIVFGRGAPTAWVHGSPKITNGVMHKRAFPCYALDMRVTRRYAPTPEKLFGLLGFILGATSCIACVLCDVCGVIGNAILLKCMLAWRDSSGTASPSKLKGQRFSPDFQRESAG